MGGYLMASGTSLTLLFAAYCVPLVLCAAAAFLAGRLVSAQQQA
jgi:hypothetical protein